jgi:sugar phosphate permease
MAEAPSNETTVYEDLLARWRGGRRRVFAWLYVTYGAFYLCRANLSPAKSTLERSVGLNKAHQGYLDFLFKAGYAAGQWIGGQLGDRYGGRLMVAVGAIGGAVMCAAFGLSSAFWAFALFWVLNGVVQSVGWPGITKTFANWFPPRVRGRLHAALSSCYQMGPAITLVLAGAIIDNFGWRSAFLMPAGVLVALGAAFAVWSKDSPQQAGLPSLERLDKLQASSDGAPGDEPPEENEEDQRDRHLGYRYTLRRTAANPRIWCLALAFLCIDIARHGTFDWLPRYFSDLDPDMKITDVALRAWTVPLGGSAGAVLAGWATDRLFGARRVPLAVVLLAVVGGLILVWARYSDVISGHSHLFLTAMGFFIYAPQVLIVGPIAMDLATRKAAASATGLVGTVGYAGAAVMSVVSGQILETYQQAGDPMGGWHLLFSLWAGAAFLGVLFMLPLWRLRPGEGEYY